MKSYLFLFDNNTFFLLRAADQKVCSLKAQQECDQILRNVCSGSSKKISGDTRNNWVTMMFVTKNRYKCFRKHVIKVVAVDGVGNQDGKEFTLWKMCFNYPFFYVKNFQQSIE